MSEETKLIPTEDASGKPIHYEFDEAYQDGILNLALRDNTFMRGCSQLLFPEHFENIERAIVCKFALDYYSRYGATTSNATIVKALKEAIERKVIPSDYAKNVVARIQNLIKQPLPAKGDFEVSLGTFAREQAVQNAIIQSVDLLNNHKFDKIQNLMHKALNVGVDECGEEYDYFEKLKDRKQLYIDRSTGAVDTSGITTGVKQLDDLLYHKGWGRKELSVIMGGAKSGKTTALIGFAKFACARGYNVLYVTLEVSANIIAERLDANIGDVAMKDLNTSSCVVSGKVDFMHKTSGIFKIREFASGSLRPSRLRLLLEQYRNNGIVFDLVCVDYADIMTPERKTDNIQENSKDIYIGLRAIAFDFNVAVLSATQTNREGFKAKVAMAEHVAEDFNKVRTVDLMISINATEEEKKRGEARLYFAASRNQVSGCTLRVRQDIEKMKFITGVLGVE
jgi:replicative DNA helicase